MKRFGKYSTKDLVKFLTKNGFRIWEIKGSHYVMTNVKIQLQFPMRKELGRGTLEASLERAGFTMEDFEKGVKG